jgi:hypothetical protein
MTIRKEAKNGTANVVKALALRRISPIRMLPAYFANGYLAWVLVEVQSDPDLAIAWRERFVNPIRKARRPIIARAIARGEIPAGSDPELIMDVLYGPLYHRYLNGHLPLDGAFARGVGRMAAAAALDGAAVSVPRSAR